MPRFHIAAIAVLGLLIGVAARGASDPGTLCPTALEPSYPTAVLLPPIARAALGPLECLDEHKVLYIPPKIPEADIIFVMDVTGSMGEEIAQVAMNIDQIANDLLGLVENPAFVLISHRDYTYDPAGTDCGYNSRYGAEYAYQLELPLTNDIVTLRSVLFTLTAFGGSDMPESYSRALYEAYTDPSLMLRRGSQKIVIAFGDNIPHDCDIYACIGKPGTSTGIDLGPDDTPGTPDDLPIMSVIDEMQNHCMTLLELYSENVQDNFDSWSCWAARTGGQAFQVNPDGTIPGGFDLPMLLTTMIDSATSVCRTVRLAAEPGFESWLVTVTPPEYVNLARPANVTFDIQLCPPAGTPPGRYTFKIEAQCDVSDCGGGAILTSQDVVLDVCGATAEAGSDREVCQGSAVTLDGTASVLQYCVGGAEYRWLEGPVDVCPWSASPICSRTPSAGTTYTLEVRCASSIDCRAQDTVTVRPVTPPQPAAGPDDTVCDNETILLDGGQTPDPGCPGGLEYRWMEGAVEVCPWSSNPRCNLPPQLIGAHTYSLETRCAGLPGCATSDSAVITVRQCTTPVRFGGYGARASSSGSVEVWWTTLEEIDTVAFEVQCARSPEPASGFTALGVVPAHGSGRGYSGIFRCASPETAWIRIVEISSGDSRDSTPAFRAATRVIDRGTRR